MSKVLESMNRVASNGSHAVVPDALASVTCSIEFVTPASAEKWLGRNTNNYRKARNNAIKMIAEDITSGDFDFTNATIAFDIDELLVDGQHRLSAVVESGKGIWTFVVRGMPKGSCDSAAIDTGTKRSVSTHLHKHGIANANVTAAVGRYLFTLHRGRASRDKVSDKRLSEIIKANPSIAVAAGMATSCQRLCPQKISGAWIWIASFDDDTLLDECLDILAGKSDASLLHPFAKLREAFIAKRHLASGYHGTSESNLCWRLFCSAWEKAKAGDTVKLLRPASSSKAFLLPDEAGKALTEMWGAK